MLIYFIQKKFQLNIFLILENNGFLWKFEQIKYFIFFFNFQTQRDSGIDGYYKFIKL